MIWSASTAKFNYELAGSTVGGFNTLCVCGGSMHVCGHVCVVEAARGRSGKC